VLGELQDLRAVPVQGHRRGLQRAADLAHGGRALDAVAAVGVVAGDAAELAACGLGGLRVVLRGLGWRGGAGERPEFQQRAGGGRAVEAAVADDGALMGALGAAVVFPD
jgi:hypothetical protein